MGTFSFIVICAVLCGIAHLVAGWTGFGAVLVASVLAVGILAYENEWGPGE